MAQEIGLKAKFDVRDFNRGLNSYVTGLNRAVTATINAQTGITAAGNNFSRVFGTASIALFAMANQARNLATSLGQATRSASGLSQRISAQASAARQANGQIRGLVRSFRDLNTASVAVGTAFGVAAVESVRAFGAALRSAATTVVETVTFFERLQLSIEFYAARSLKSKDDTLSFNDALAQTSDVAEGTLFWIQRLAVASPFTTRDVGTLFRTSQAYGLLREEAELLTPLLLDFAAAAGLDRDILERLALAIGQVRARGKLTGEEVRQLGNSGIPIRDILVKALNIANEEFDNLLESGALTSDKVIPAIIESLQEFEGAGERVAFGTIGGIISAFDELAEISVAKFFRGALEPLQEEFQRLFDVLNQPQVLAFIEVLGKEFGVVLFSAFENLKASISGLIAAWQNLDPTIKQAAITFGVVFVAVSALLAATGILFFAINALINPVTIVAAAFAGLAALWVRSGGKIIDTMIDIERFVTETFTSIARSATNFGFSVIDFFVTGMVNAMPGVVNAMGLLGSILSFFLSPNSPPRVAPNIDDWGKTTTEFFFKGMGKPSTAIVNRSARQLTETVERVLDDATQATPPRPPVGLFDPIVRAAKQSGIDVAKKIQEAEPEVAEAGIDLGAILGKNFLEGVNIAQPIKVLSKELSEALAQFGKGRQLSISGASVIDQFLESFKKADFSALSGVGGIIQDTLGSFVDLGVLDEIDIPFLLSEFRESFARGISEFRKFGVVSEGVFDGIRAAAGPAAKGAIDFLGSYIQLAVSTDVLEDAQNRLNAVTEKYKEIIKPLRQELEKISDARRTIDENREIAELQRVIANEAAGALRKQSAELGIQEILQRRLLAVKEKERDAALEVGEEEVKSAEKTQKKAEDNFDILQATLDARNDQLSLVAKESSIFARLEAEVAKLREKEKSTLELQTALLKLQQDELKDIVKEARAKYTLSQAESTELEKQQALLDLQEIAFRRQGRILEARELGFKPEEITKLSDIALTLDDLNIKSEKALAGVGPSMDDIISKIPDMTKLSEEWRVKLEEVRGKWEEIKGEISATAQEINDKLPTFLKIFPEEEGEEAPLVKTLKEYQNGILILAGVFALTSIVGQIQKLGVAFAIVRAIIAGPVVVSALGAIATALTPFVPIIGAVLLALGALTLAWQTNFLNIQGITKEAASNIGAEFTRIAEGIAAFGEFFTTFWSTLFTSEGRQNLRKGLSNVISAFGDKQLRDEIISEVVPLGALAVEEFNKSVQAQGFGPAAAISFALKIPAIVKDEEPIKEHGFEVASTLFGGMTEGLDTLQPEISRQMSEAINLSTQGLAISDEASSNLQAQLNAVLLQGVNPEAIGQSIFGAISEGVTSGLVLDDAELAKASADMLAAIEAKMKQDGEISSPSELTKREVGVPLGEGVLAGLKSVLDGTIETVGDTVVGFAKVLRDSALPIIEKFSEGGSSAFAALVTDAIKSIESMRINTKIKLTLLNLNVTESLRALTTIFSESFTAIRTDSETAISGMSESVVQEFNSLNTQISTIMSTIKGIIVGSFADAKTESELEIQKLTGSVTALFGGDEDSMLSEVRRVFVGLEGAVPAQIGADFITGLATGITDNKQVLATALVGAIEYAFGEAAAFGEISSPSQLAARSLGFPIAQGVSTGILQGAGLISSSMQSAVLSSLNAPINAQFASGPSSIVPGNISNVSRTNNFNLNVSSSVPSQGISRDFGIMETMAGSFN